MSYRYHDVENLENHPLVGTGQCAALVQWYAHVPGHSILTWKEGAKVRGNKTILKGTAIATFVNGMYPTTPHDKHAALYISQDANGIRVMDQWPADPRKPNVSSRIMYFKGKNKDGTYVNPSNNGDALSVIELMSRPDLSNPDEMMNALAEDPRW